MQDIVQLVSTVGFPIVFCFLMWKYISDNNSQIKNVITEFTATMREFQVTMTENNRLMAIICDKLDVRTEVKRDDDQLR